MQKVRDTVAQTYMLEQCDNIEQKLHPDGKAVNFILIELRWDLSCPRTRVLITQLAISAIMMIISTTIIVTIIMHTILIIITIC